MIGSATVARFASRCWGMYAVGIGMTAACGVVYVALRGLVLLFDAWPGDVMQQHRHREAVVVRGVAHRGSRSGARRRCRPRHQRVRRQMRRVRHAYVARTFGHRSGS